MFTYKRTEIHMALPDVQSKSLQPSLELSLCLIVKGAKNCLLVSLNCSWTSPVQSMEEGVSSPIVSHLRPESSLVSFLTSPSQSREQGASSVLECWQCIFSKSVWQLRQCLNLMSQWTQDTNSPSQIQPGLKTILVKERKHNLKMKG